ncbi:DEAD-domain-containing protein [Pseudovirgaria hyperparasitica]|uniref:ATP-dependent RNA helicase n=1 Tax=Pseudovirgaria hyperparasitica TaxID=470096 RepID=A0A6A6WBI6_9PEZI|nr:DEAD-domain-containing protein [Pseudovirgaria hyperparasitica]KAF2758471.1 DEAD-domain-containing protein [Pseudovirgaria hyperparasitica]
MLGTFRRCPASIARTLSLCPQRAVRVVPSFSQNAACLRATSIQTPSRIASFHSFTRLQQQAEAQETEKEPQQYITRFEDLGTGGLVHPNLVKAITSDMKLETMTEVQSKSINAAISGVDVVAQAKTGTGKTLAFLTPLIHRILLQEPSLGSISGRYKARARPSDIRAIIISPTRELAEQIANEAKRVTARTDLVVQVAVGGTQKGLHLSQVRREGCHILVGTPGRLNDILADPQSGISAPNLDCFVMDEADRLLEAGFTKEIEQIKQSLPDVRERPRQQLMFSATLPNEVVQMVRRTLRPGFQFVKCVDENEAPTHERVPQKLVEARGLENMTPALVELCNNGIAEPKGGRPFKAIIFINTTADVSLTFEALAAYQKLNRMSPLSKTRVLQIHAKLTQSARTRRAEIFRNAESAILVSSDVTARGMDFPNVTHVIQFGSPRAREDYIHRIGRTARAGKEGEAWLLVDQQNSRHVRGLLRGIPIKADTSLQTASVNMTQEGQVPAAAAEVFAGLREAYRRVPYDFKKASYSSMFGVAGGSLPKQTLVDTLNDLAIFGWGLTSPPSIGRSMAAKLGLSRCRGINTGPDENQDEADVFQSQDAGEMMSRGGMGGGQSFGSRFGGRGGGGGGRGRDFGGRGGDFGGRGGDFGGRGGDFGGRGGDFGERRGRDFGGRGGDFGERRGRDSGRANRPWEARGSQSSRH